MLESEAHPMKEPQKAALGIDETLKHHGTPPSQLLRIDFSPFRGWNNLTNMPLWFSAWDFSLSFPPIGGLDW